MTTADYYYSEDSFTSQHAIIEASLDLGSLISYGTGDALTIGIFWGPSCGNDRLDSIVSFIAPPIHLTSVPAPGGALLYGLGLLALQWRRRRRARAA